MREFLVGRRQHGTGFPVVSSNRKVARQKAGVSFLWVDSR